MPVSYRINALEECIVLDLHGTVTDADLLEAQQTLFGDPLFHGHYARFIEAAAEADFRVTARVVARVARAAAQRGLRRAALVAHSDLVFAMMRVYESYASEADCHVFRNRTEAQEWLFATLRDDL